MQLVHVTEAEAAFMRVLALKDPPNVHGMWVLAHKVACKTSHALSNRCSTQLGQMTEAAAAFKKAHALKDPTTLACNIDSPCWPHYIT